RAGEAIHARRPDAEDRRDGGRPPDPEAALATPEREEPGGDRLEGGNPTGERTMSDEITARIDRAARAFNEAASELALAMLGKLEKDEPELAAKVAQALERGERMVVA